MTTKRGISLLDLLNIPPGSQGVLPPDVAAQLEKLAILDYHSTTSDSAIIHYGTVQSLADMALPALREWPVQAPGLNTGLSFQLTVKRIAAGAGQNLEPAPDTFQLDLFLNPVAIEIPGLRPATLIPGGNGAPARLGDDPKRTKVQIVGSGVLRIALTPDETLPIVRFVDAPDPFDPDAPTGPVFSLAFSPPHFFLGASEFGLTVDRLTFDDSETFTPPDIIERGQPDSWRGTCREQLRGGFTVGAGGYGHGCKSA